VIRMGRDQEVFFGLVYTKETFRGFVVDYTIKIILHDRFGYSSLDWTCDSLKNYGAVK
jgi:hypothetical protein